jgi:dihydrofolate reductase
MKYVVTHRPIENEWRKTVCISANVPTVIRQIKEETGPMLQVHGSSGLIQLLLANDLVDELWLKTFPVVLGKGKRLFGEGVRPGAYKLVKSTITAGGVVAANYERDGMVRTGSF